MFVGPVALAQSTTPLIPMGVSEVDAMCLVLLHGLKLD
jgi:hypothetical protein